MRLASILVLAVAVATAGRPASARSSDVAASLDRYVAGDFDAVVAELTAANQFDDVLKGLQHDGRAWIESGSAADRGRRELAAATFALEAARAATDTSDWKWVQRINLNAPTARPADAILPGILPQSYGAANAVWWKSPPLLIEWACALLRSSPAPRPFERTWQLAAVAVAQRAGDFEFLIGSPWEARGDPGSELDHLKHVIKRFPAEPRFALAQAIAMEWHTWATGFRIPRTRVVGPVDAIGAFQKMTNDDAIGAEALVRLGFLRLRTGKPDDALPLFDRADAATRDPYLVYLARYFRGQAWDRKSQPVEAERAYRGALAAIPRAQSATVALSSLLARAGRLREASDVVEDSLSAPPVLDPWREFEAADNRFWPTLLGRLRAEIHPRETGDVR